MELRQNSILRISDEKTMELINLYETEECLWNTALETYKHRQTRHRAAERIAKKLDIKHFTSRYVVIKFKNLRNSYCQELKKVANSVKAGDEPVYKPKVFWFNKMDSFLRPHLQHHTNHTTERKSSHKISVKPEPTETVQFSNPEDVYLVETNYYSDSEEFEEEEPLRKRSRKSSNASRRIEESHEGGTHDLPRTMNEAHEGGSNNLARMMKESHESGSHDLARMMKESHEGGSHDLARTMKESHEGGSHDLARMMKDISCHLHVLTNQSQDCFDSFGRYVSAMLRGMPARRAMEVQPQIVSLLVAATLKSEDKETIT